MVSLVVVLVTPFFTFVFDLYLSFVQTTLDPAEGLGKTFFAPAVPAKPSDRPETGMERATATAATLKTFRITSP